MSRSQALAAAAILLGLGWMPTGSQAAAITETFAFTASGFSAGAPFDPVSGRVTIQYDLDVTQGPTSAPTFSSRLPDSYGPFFFAYRADARQLVFGDNCTFTPPGIPGCSISGGTNQATLSFNVDAAGLPEPGEAELDYATVSSPFVFGAEAVVRVATGVGTPAPVPEPAALALFASGLLGLAVVRRPSRSRR